jgi:hypothetical protein
MKPIICQAIIQVSRITHFHDCGDTVFEYCTFWSDEISSAEITKKLVGVRTPGCAFFGNECGKDFTHRNISVGNIRTDAIAYNCVAWECPSRKRTQIFSSYGGFINSIRKIDGDITITRLRCGYVKVTVYWKD